MSTDTVNAILRDVERSSSAVRSWLIETGPDASGSDAVWVWVTLDDDALDVPTTDRVRKQIRRAVLERGGEHAPWVYVRFRGASETVPN